MKCISMLMGAAVYCVVCQSLSSCCQLAQTELLSCSGNSLQRRLQYEPSLRGMAESRDPVRTRGPATLQEPRVNRRMTCVRK